MIWLIALLTAIPPTIAAVASLLVALKSDRKITENDKKISEIHISLNGRMTELLELNRIAAHAEGRQQERDVQQTAVEEQKK